MFKKSKKKKMRFQTSNIHDKTIYQFVTQNVSDKFNCEKLIKTYEDNDSKETILEVENLNKSFGKNHVLKDLTFNLYKNEHVGLIGGNGAGKTTLVEIISGINKADNGKIVYNFEYKNSFQEGIGIQFQDSNYPKGITVKKIIEFVQKTYNSKLNKDELLGLVNLFGIYRFYNSKASSLSGGQSQRLNCLLAILHKPKFLILDELSTGLDITILNRIKSFIKQYAIDNGITILLISHNMNEVDYLAERIILLKRGQIYLDARKNDIVDKWGSLEKMVEYYI